MNEQTIFQAITVLVYIISLSYVIKRHKKDELKVTEDTLKQKANKEDLKGIEKEMSDIKENYITRLDKNLSETSETKNMVIELTKKVEVHTEVIRVTLANYEKSLNKIDDSFDKLPCVKDISCKR